MASTDIDGTPILILRREEVLTICEMLRWYPGQWDDAVGDMLKKIDRFLMETGDERVRRDPEETGREGSGV